MEQFSDIPYRVRGEIRRRLRVEALGRVLTDKIPDSYRSSVATPADRVLDREIPDRTLYGTIYRLQYSGLGSAISQGSERVPATDLSS